jgi:murein DD-endopeptidase MepM/ murein hydrolase activator NlpD
MGAPVRAAATGKVAYVGLRPGAYGNLVVLDHEAGWQTAYAHNDVNLVRRRQRVLAGQIIARVGATGHAASTKTPTLHFEVREHGKPHNPLRFFDLPAEPDPGLNPGEIEPETVSLLLP